MADILKIMNELGVSLLIRNIVYIMLLAGLLYKPLKSFWYDISRSRLNKLKEAYDFTGHDDNTRKFLETSLSEEYFKLTTGLSLGFGYQEKLMELYLKDNAPVAFHHYKRVAEYLKFNSDKTIQPIKIPKLFQIIGYFQEILGFYLLGSSALIFINLSHIIKDNSNKLGSNEILLVTGILVLLWAILLIGFFFILKPYIIYKSSVYVNRQMGYTNFTCFYHRVLTEKVFGFLGRKALFYIPIPLFAFLLIYFFR